MADAYEEEAGAYEEELDQATQETEEESRSLVEEALFLAILAALLGNIKGATPESVVAEARKTAQKAAGTLLKDFTATQLASMGQKIRDGLAAGKGTAEIAQSLSEVVGLDAPRAARLEKIKQYLEQSGMSPEAIKKQLEREKEKLLRERRETIARTETAEATSTARRFEAEARGAKWKYWITTADERLCDICAGNEADGVIPFEATFSGGTRDVPAHPNCRCTVQYVSTDSGKGVAEQINRLGQEATAIERRKAGK